jgi:hypothetical protein
MGTVIVVIVIIVIIVIIVVVVVVVIIRTYLRGVGVCKHGGGLAPREHGHGGGRSGRGSGLHHQLRHCALHLVLRVLRLQPHLSRQIEEATKLD